MDVYRAGLTRLGRGYGALLLGVALWATGCATAPGLRGSETTSPEGTAAERRVRYRSSQFRWGARLALGRAPARAVKEAEREEFTASARPRIPSGWPEESSSDEELLAPLLTCPATADFLALQRGVDMARVVERLGDWSAVRLGAQGPLVDARASQVLTCKRASFLLRATEDYGAFAQVFALFIVHTAFDDELDALLRLLAENKQLSQTLGHMEAVRQELERRGLRLSDYRERGEQAGDVARGLGQAARDALRSSAVSDGARYQRMSAQRLQLPPPYQQALDEMERELMREHYAVGSTALGSFDQLTFGVPLGFYHLVAGTAHGVEVLSQGQYEQATRELAPAAALVALYAGGKGARYLGEAQGAGARVRLPMPELRLEALQHVAWRLRERLGLEGVAELARTIRASREAAVFVGAGGEPAAVALYEARGNVARAQARLAEARPESTGAVEPRAASSKALGGVASLVDEAAGYSAEVVQAKLHLAELEATGPRLPADVALLEKLHSTLASPPPGVPEGSALWSDYLTYRQRRLVELEQGKAAKGPLRWESYERMQGEFARGLAFERSMVAILREDADLPVAQRRWLKDFNQPRIEVHVGVAKPDVSGIRFADVLVIEEQPPAGQAARVETMSFKSRYLAPLKPVYLRDQIAVDARVALGYYGGTLDILRHSIKRRVRVQRVRLVYEGGRLMPESPAVLKEAMTKVEQEVRGVEVLVQ